MFRFSFALSEKILVASALVKIPYIGHVREKLGFDRI